MDEGATRGHPGRAHARGKRGVEEEREAEGDPFTKNERVERGEVVGMGVRMWK